MKKENLKCIYLFITPFLPIFSSYITAQTSVKSGDIRDCSVWACSSNTFQNATIATGNAITSNVNSVNGNSITLSENTSSIVFNGTDAINLTGSTDMSVCTKTYVNNVPLMTAGDTDPLVSIGAAGKTATSSPSITAAQAGTVTITFEYIAPVGIVYCYCSGLSSSPYPFNTNFGITDGNVSVYQNSTLLFNASDIALATIQYSAITNGTLNCYKDGSNNWHYIRQWQQTVSAGDVFKVICKNTLNTVFGDPCGKISAGSITGYDINQQKLPLTVNLKITACKGTF